MERVFKFAKLDLFMIKPYFRKYLLILLAVSIPIVISSKNVYMMAFISLFYGLTMVSYPFVLSEKNNIENFYGTLSVNKKNIVNGRYIFALGVMIFFAIFSYIIMIVGNIILKEKFEPSELLFVLGTGFFMAVILLSLQLPAYFKLGYTKGKVFTYVPFILLAVGVPLFVKLIGGSAEKFKEILRYIENNTVMATSILVLAALLILQISNIVAQKFYLNKTV